MEQPGAVIPKPKPKKERKPPAGRRSRYKKKEKPCKNPDCTNMLTGRQTVGCSDACNQKIYRLKKQGKLK